MVKSECHFIHGTDRLRFVERNISNREQFLHFGSDVGLDVGTPLLGTRFSGTGTATRNGWSTDGLRWTGTAGTTTSCPARSSWSAEVSVGQNCHTCRPPSPSSPQLIPMCSHSLPMPPCVHLTVALELSAQPQLPALLHDGFLPCQNPAEVVPGPVGALRACGGHQPGPQWGLDFYQLLVLLETPPGTGSAPAARQPDTARSKVLMGIGGSVLGFVFLALGLGFYGDKKVGGSRGSCYPSAVKLPT
ncbi:hypothetical protein IHE44_0014696 [Lamprotornis superbus]|uniref:MHC class II beta chain N-terminal domain-containing protein n=1 Tax=Lamprotornis superbus TaxID=245042 RepID=A0A835NDJ4_9PASS|nr:hypothetical protein IHE44_0014696 [Lamprotornis superbus]